MVSFVMRLLRVFRGMFTGVFACVFAAVVLLFFSSSAGALVYL